MKAVIGRGIVLTFLFIAIAAVYIYFLLGLPLEESWFAFYELQFADVPLGWWILNTILLLAWGIASWTRFLGSTKEKAIEQKLTDLIDSEKDADMNMKFSPRMNRAIGSLSTVIHTQRKSLQRIIDERAEEQDKLIQERIVQERQRLARELHDSVSQQLFAASMLLSAITESNEDAVEQKPLLQVERIVQQAQLEMRALLLHLRPAALNNKSLSEGLEELLVELREKVLFDIRFRLEEVTLSKGAEDHLFRIAQETLSNTLRHAQATVVDVLFVERDGLAIFRVQDNGVGFKDSDGKGGSYGLQNVKERAIEIGGTCKIVSVPSQGTIVEVKLPARKGDEPNDQDSVSG
ncbi:sensor histidine kinase [Sporosarcina sp. JAI121]|uniref:sensor histidine kinase n=1 Tax=Sporosarcina sp. JAI121 TaxID=2723064 RepID=UPI0015C823AA|nr:sensor histidine kinase [Sporosarcina sp. JAI121]NYF23292.1 two-component system vancomycin resistance sensor histidine kinase VraS/NarL family two-component system sensor histidine kinase LiaS [Sporosarcina sp. JAI121]